MLGFKWSNLTEMVPRMTYVSIVDRGGRYSTVLIGCVPRLWGVTLRSALRIDAVLPKVFLGRRLTTVELPDG